ncbi:hypothetical protein Bca4012_007242 [Brassica carinata]|uniref:BnaC03g62260D protein n=7 Tax=Brassica TaxID=3705 RepID=A0A078HY44_BRANA|nr:defensin-like protein 159 [Brassica napus]XP_048607540.1 defensin-like protein 159 [Brassica napus]KAF2580405.1 hypothetical protein F2Q68_00006120 [Brassica cretica]KAG2291292.1 hypothetical protein Bca52824_037961 [Brassica carinata]VDC98974.1 unnamed protein product [Brassica oleracea]KAF3551416.1 hypothetical protein DY000_02009437 [Brassica cretica]KAH0894093.1 hypothetical protein HID58_056522 [Brassica napus]
MAKLSCSYFLVLMIVFSMCLMVERAEGKLCEITIDKERYCPLSSCVEDCYALYNGVAHCLDDPNVPGPSNCRCTYNC